MKRIEFNELIEKAFSMGYEEAQKEFGIVKRENKKKKREWLEKLGKEKGNKKDRESNKFNIFFKLSKNNAEPEDLVERENIINSGANVRSGRKFNYDSQYKDWGNPKNLNEVINRRENWITELSGKSKEERNENGIVYNKILLKKLKEKRNLKKAGLALAGTAAVTSAVYGAKKLYDKKKKKKKKEQEEQNKKAED